MQIIQNRCLLFQLKITFSLEFQYIINEIEMRKCGYMLAFFIVILLIASHFMEDEERINEGLEVAIELKQNKVTRP